MMVRNTAATGRGAALVPVGAFLVTLLSMAPVSARGHDAAPLLTPAETRALASHLSGTRAKRHVQALTLHHRMRGSRGFEAAAGYVRDQLASGGIETVTERLPADGSIMYGTQRSRPAWDADSAELWEIGGGAGSGTLIASWASRPVTLAQDSASGEAEGDLVDVGEGTDVSDYEGRQVAGRFVLAGAQPEQVAPIAVGQFGAAGIVSYAPNQRSAWWKQDASLVRWGHLGTFPPPGTFAFMVSLDQARAWQGRLARGESVRLRGSVRAGQHPGAYVIVTALIPAAEGGLSGEEILFSCHLDHLTPGANDNASGCATILEIASTLNFLIRDGALPAPRRGIRFIWPPEIEGTIALLNARPDYARRTAAVVHMDMVGGAPDVTKAIFHVTRSPASLPTFVDDVAAAVGRFVNEQSEAHAGGAEVPFPLVDPEGGREALQARFADFTMGSDHQVWTEGSFRIPAIYLNDWPDRYIHTHRDSVANIDATKLLRAGFIGAASAWILANLDEDDVTEIARLVRRGALRRMATLLDLGATLAPAESLNLVKFHLDREERIVDSIGRFAPLPERVRARAVEEIALLKRIAVSDAGSAPVAEDAPASPSGDAGIVYRRSIEPKGPMTGFGYDYFEARLAALDIPRPALLSFEGARGAGSEYAYEALNLVDGQRGVAAIRDALSAIYGPIGHEIVAEYLAALEAMEILLRIETP